MGDAVLQFCSSKPVLSEAQTTTTVRNSETEKLKGKSEQGTHERS